MDTFYVDQLSEFSENIPSSISANDLVKRTFDIVMSTVGLLFLSPLFLVVAILLKHEGPGPVFYRGPRIGRGGKPFGILKFRTMYERPESYTGARITASGDARITPLGQWLRNTKINELPQLWNVLVGEMSLVGPRPEDPEIASHWPEQARREILSVRPGVTSPTSVAYYNEERLLNSKDVMAEYLERIQPDKLRLDRLYVRHHNFLTDLDAIFWTLIILLPKTRKDKLSEGWLFGGPFTRLAGSYVSWFIIDFVLAMGCIGVMGVIWRADRPFDLGLGLATGLAVLVAFLFGFFNTLLGVKTVSWDRAAPEDVIRLFLSAVIVIAINVIAHQVMPVTSLPVDFIFATSLLFLLVCVVARYRFRLLSGFATRWVTMRSSGYGAGERVLIVGAGDGGSFAAWLLRRSEFQKLYSVVGIVDDDPAKQGRHYDGYKVLGTIADVPDLVRHHDIGVIFYAISKISMADGERTLSLCRATGRHVVVISTLIKSLQEHLAGSPEVAPENLVPNTAELVNQAEAIII